MSDRKWFLLWLILRKLLFLCALSDIRNMGKVCYLGTYLTWKVYQLFLKAVLEVLLLYVCTKFSMHEYRMHEKAWALHSQLIYVTYPLIFFSLLFRHWSGGGILHENFRNFIIILSQLCMISDILTDKNLLVMIIQASEFGQVFLGT